MTYEQMTKKANARFNEFAAKNKNASKSLFDKFPLELRIEMTFEFFSKYCAN